MTEDRKFDQLDKSSNIPPQPQPTPPPRGKLMETQPIHLNLIRDEALAVLMEVYGEPEKLSSSTLDGVDAGTDLEIESGFGEIDAFEREELSTPNLPAFPIDVDKVLENAQVQNPFAVTAAIPAVDMSLSEGRIDTPLFNAFDQEQESEAVLEQPPLEINFQGLVKGPMPETPSGFDQEGFIVDFGELDTIRDREAGNKLKKLLAEEAAREAMEQTGKESGVLILTEVAEESVAGDDPLQHLFDEMELPVITGADPLQMTIPIKTSDFGEEEGKNAWQKYVSGPLKRWWKGRKN